MAKRNRTRYTILGALTHGDMSGYDLKRFIERTIGNFWRESYGQIYPTLNKLEAQGLVGKEAREGQGRPGRNVYTLTAAGRRELKDWLVMPAEREVLRNELLLKLFFGSEVDEEDNLRHVARHREELRHGIEKLRGIADRLMVQAKGKSGLPFWLLGIRMGILVDEALLHWCEEAEACLKGDLGPAKLFEESGDVAS